MSSGRTSLLEERHLLGRERIRFGGASDRRQHECREHKRAHPLAPNSSLHAFDHLPLDTNRSERVSKQRRFEYTPRL